MSTDEMIKLSRRLPDLESYIDTPQSWEDFQDAKFLALQDGVVVQFNGALFVRDRLSAGTDLPAGGGWSVGVCPSVRSYGAVGDGVTSDSPSFAAMTAQEGLKNIPYSKDTYRQAAPNPRPVAGAVLPDPSMSWRNLTDDGKFDWERDHFTRIWDVGMRGAAIWRLADRVFVAGAAVNMAGDLDGVDAGNSWATVKSEAADYLPILAKHLVISNDGKVAYNASVRTSDNQPTHFVGIGYGANVINDKVGSGAWGGILEMQHEEGVWTCGWEIVMKNKSGDNLTLSPYYRSLGTPGGGDFGFWLIAGGDNAFGGSANAPSNSAIAINRNQSAGNAVSCWNNGIIFEAGSLSGTDGSATDTGFGRAIVMARRHALIWETPDGTGRGARILGSVTTQAKQVSIDMSDDQIVFGGISGPMLRVRHVAGGVNYIDVNNNAAAGSPKMKAAGAGDIDIQIEGLGAGGVRLNGNDGVSKVRINATGVGFFNVNPVARQSVGAAATDAATVQTLVNAIRTALINNGLLQA